MTHGLAFLDASKTDHRNFPMDLSETFSVRASCFRYLIAPTGKGTISTLVANLLLGSKFSLQARIDVWNQPSLLLGGETVEKTRPGLGGAVFGNFFYKLTDAPLKMGVTAHIVYKTTGYLEGEKLSRDVIFRVGFGFLE